MKIDIDNIERKEKWIEFRLNGGGLHRRCCEWAAVKRAAGLAAASLAKLWPNTKNILQIFINFQLQLHHSCTTFTSTTRFCATKELHTQEASLLKIYHLLSSCDRQAKNSTVRNEIRLVKFLEQRPTKIPYKDIVQTFNGFEPAAAMLSEAFATSIRAQPKSANTAIAKDVGIYLHELHPSHTIKSSFKKSSTPVNALAISATHIFAAQADKAVIHVYSRERGNQESLISFPERIHSLALIGDGVLALGTAEGRVILWEVSLSWICGIDRL